MFRSPACVCVFTTTLSLSLSIDHTHTWYAVHYCTIFHICPVGLISWLRKKIMKRRVKNALLKLCFRSERVLIIGVQERGRSKEFRAWPLSSISGVLHSPAGARLAGLLRWPPSAESHFTPTVWSSSEFRKDLIQLQHASPDYKVVNADINE